MLRDMLRDRRYEFALERSVFMTVLHRLFASGSDRAAERWMQGQAIAGTEELSLHHLYRTMGFLGEPLHEPPPLDVPIAAKGRAAASATGPYKSDDPKAPSPLQVKGGLGPR